jgi:hypothetical protein
MNPGVRREEIERVIQSHLETREIVYVGSEVDTFEDDRGARLGIYRPIIDRAEVREPPRTIIDLSRADHVVIREYADTRTSSAPSVALLMALDNRERQRVQNDRLSEQISSVESEIARLQNERAALLDQRRQEAERPRSQVEAEKQQAAHQRLDEQHRFLEQRK